MSANELVYKGYTGSVEVSIEDGCLHGRVLFIDDLITYEGKTVDEIKTAFQNATDRYIAYCEKTGKPANKPYSGTFNVRIGADRHRTLAQLAYKNKTSINEAVCQAIDSFQKAPHAPVAVDETLYSFFKLYSNSPIRQATSKPATSLSIIDFAIKEGVDLEKKVVTHPSYGTC